MTRPSLPVFLPRRKLPELAEALGFSVILELSVEFTSGLEPGRREGVLSVGMLGGGSSSRRGLEGSRVMAGGVYLGAGLEEFFVLGIEFFFVEGAALEEPEFIRLVGGRAGEVLLRGGGGVS